MGTRYGMWQSDMLEYASQCEACACGCCWNWGILTHSQYILHNIPTST